MNDVLALKEKRNKLWEECKSFLETHRGADGCLSNKDFATYKLMESDIVAMGKEIDKMETRNIEPGDLAQPARAFEFESAVCKTDRVSTNLFDLIAVLADICYCLTAESPNRNDAMPSAECYIQQLEILEKNSNTALEIARKIKTAISG
jgi:hypothetical protein